MLPQGYSIRLARRDDVPVIVELLSDDQLGKTREVFADGVIDSSYYHAFDQISCDRNNELLVLENNINQVIGTLQITYMTTLTFRGATRAQLEGVRIKSEFRGKGLGMAFVQDAISRTQERNCRFVQLTTNKLRPEALNFYQKLGFSDSHIGLKLDLCKPQLEPVLKISEMKNTVMFSSVQNTVSQNKKASENSFSATT